MVTMMMFLMIMIMIIVIVVNAQRNCKGNDYRFNKSLCFFFHRLFSVAPSFLVYSSVGMSHMPTATTKILYRSFFSFFAVSKSSRCFEIDCN